VQYLVEHFQAIVGFRETERKNWNQLNSKVIQRLQETAFDPKGTRLLPYVHVLDLADDGFIKPHIDSSRVSWKIPDI
jgi:alkylated DNA repair protein alkB family protein 7